MMSPRTSVWIAAIMVLVAGAVADAQQSRPYGQEVYQAPLLGAPNNPYSDYPYTEVQAVPAARARAAIARMELLRAQGTLDRGTRAAVRSFEKSEDMTQATAEQTAAYQQYEAARQRALEPLRNDERYRAAELMKQKLSEEIVELHEKTTPDLAILPEKPVLHEIIAMAGLKLNYAVQMTNREVELLRDNAEVADARQRLVEASNRVSSLRRQFDQDVREDPDLIAARRSVFDQKVAQVASQAYLLALKEARGIALDYAYFVRRHNPYRVMGWDPYGFGRSYYGYAGYGHHGYR